jgi:hypothetical protein
MRRAGRSLLRSRHRRRKVLKPKERGSLLAALEDGRFRALAGPQEARQLHRLYWFLRSICHPLFVELPHARC